MSKEKIKRLIVLDKIRWDPDPGVLFEGRIQIRIRNRVFFLEGLIQIWFFLEYLIRLRFSLEDLIRIWCYSRRSDPITVFFLEGLLRIRFFLEGWIRIGIRVKPTRIRNSPEDLKIWVDRS